eukprot:CAMPEP_0175055450 /NCGR_PEP_ID=MMETSP0052_2-20121109/10085_1 /TAXON_ID=51329 ORGANISM="Polytomella parva, Strain SAG 63-3" /NCGR_SAMPLE_ID=MMETSP0052_2 /ASSEMBLY_ACC=CAM_ASM_000194 /LENGTH=147 /DNA_ID=CAMNT_0016320293 /DNA_START=362 /DNA_END=805 /DNA_ORIENTATION=-
MSLLSSSLYFPLTLLVLCSNPGGRSDNVLSPDDEGGDEATELKPFGSAPCQIVLDICQAFYERRLDFGGQGPALEQYWVQLAHQIRKRKSLFNLKQNDFPEGVLDGIAQKRLEGKSHIRWQGLASALVDRQFIDALGEGHVACLQDV